jgi:uncharacterized protein YdhG (YjbR/CyaY superfamily)
MLQRDTDKKTFATIDEYIAQYPPDVRETLQNLRAVINEVAPDATEKISYQMPTFYLNGNLVHFAAYAQHIGFIRHRVGLKHLKRKSRNTKAPKVPYSFR